MGGGTEPPQNETLTVTFYSNAPDGTTASGTMPPQTFTAGMPFTLAKNAFSIGGYKFIGWTDSPSEEEPLYEDGAEITVSKNIALYAVWKEVGTPSVEEDKFTVTFNANAPEGTSASGTMKPQTLTEGTAQALTKNAFTIEGYKFIGWAESPEAAEVKYTDGQEIPVSSDITLYAVWEEEEVPPEENKPTVTFNANAPQGFTVQGSMPPQSSEDSWLTLAKNAFSVPQHIFKGWATDASSKEAEYKDAQENFMLTENIVLYAVWEYWLSVDDKGNLIVQNVDDVPSDVVIPEGVTTIGETIYLGGTFTDIFEQFETVTIPSTLETINTGLAFTNMKPGFWPVPVLGIDKRTKELPFKFIVDENNPHFKTNDSGNMLLSKDGTELYFVTNSSSDYTIPPTVKSIMEGAFIGANIQTIELDGVAVEANFKFQNCTKLTSAALSNITKIDGGEYDPSSLFLDCTALESADLSDSGVTVLAQSVFSGCTNLSEVKLPSGLVEFYGSYTFSGCENLQSLTIPASLKTIKSSTFSECSIQTITFEGTKEQWSAIQVLSDYDKEFLKSITVKDSSGNIIVQQ